MQLITKGKPEVIGRTAHGMIGSVGVTLHSDLKQVLRDFTALYPQRFDSDKPDDRTIRIEVRRAGRSTLGRSLYRITADGYEVGGQYPSNGIFPLVEWGINLRIMATRNEFVQLHAASMVFQRNGFVFAGESGSGKSTLAATLLAHGWQYLCDEFALIDKSSLSLHPFPKALCIKSGSYPAIRKLGLPFARRRDYVKAFKGRVGYINPRALGNDPIGRAAAVRYIVFPSYKPNAAPSLLPIAKADAVTDLYRCCFNKDACPADTLATLTDLVKKADCHRLVVGDASETVRLIESLCNRPLSVEFQMDEQRSGFRPRPLKLIDRVASRRNPEGRREAGLRGPVRAHALIKSGIRSREQSQWALFDGHSYWSTLRNRHGLLQSPVRSWGMQVDGFGLASDLASSFEQRQCNCTKRK